MKLRMFGKRHRCCGAQALVTLVILPSLTRSFTTAGTATATASPLLLPATRYSLLTLTPHHDQHRRAQSQARTRRGLRQRGGITPHYTILYYTLLYCTLLMLRYICTVWYLGKITIWIFLIPDYSNCIVTIQLYRAARSYYRTTSLQILTLTPD